jgi:hypothetical protein
VLDDPTSVAGARYAALAASSMIPYGGMLVDFTLGGGSANNPFDLASIVPGIAFARDIFGTAKTIAMTGDLVRPLADMANRYGGITAGVVNRMPGFAEDLASRNVGRSLRSATPNDIEMRSFSGGAAANPGPMALYLRRAENAAFGGDTATAKSAIDQAVRYRMQQKGLTQQQATNEVRQQLSARQPDMRVYGRVLADTERKRVVSNMLPKQRASYEQGQRVYRSLVGLTGGGAKRRAGRRPAGLRGKRNLRQLRTKVS